MQDTSMKSYAFISTLLFALQAVPCLHAAVLVNETGDNELTPPEAPCECVSLDQASITYFSNEYIMKCNQRKRTTIPVIQCEGDVHTLDMKGNSITEVHLVVASNLRVLQLSSNRIYKIEPEAFKTLEHLEQLYLDNNDIATLEPHVFYDLKNLIVLDLSNNRLKRLPVELFASQTKLQSLKLSGNPLRYFDVKQFENLQGLSTLYLRNIQSHNLLAGIFHDLNNLQFIDLSDNEFDDVPIDALRSAPKLKELVFESNPIKTLDEKSFNKLVYLETLRINANRNLRYIKRFTFSSLVSLKRLYLEYNPSLSIINSGAFEDPNKTPGSSDVNGLHIPLKELHLKQNGLKTLSKNLLPWPSIAVVDVRGNPWHCTCEIEWLKTKLISEEHSEIVNDVKCSGPKAVKGQEVASLKSEEFICEAEHEVNGRDVILRTFLVILTITLVVFSVSMILFAFKKKKLCCRGLYRKRGTGAVYYVKAHTNPIDTTSDI